MRDNGTYDPTMRLARLAIATTALTALVASTVSAAAFDGSWSRVATGTTGGVSGLAAADTGWLIVRDNKLAGQNRIARLDEDGRVTSLAWPGTAPQDLESLAAVPGMSGTYVTLTSAGRGYVISLGATSVAVSRTFTVPRGSANIESFALTSASSALVALWATHGSPTAPAKLSAATISLTTGAFGRVAKVSVTVPYPTTAVRHISDLAVVGSRIVASSTSDPGANGPFASALYDLGSVSVLNGRAVLSMHAPTSLATYAGHKVEGIACAGTTGLLGSDDEKQGGWVRTESFCG